MRPFILVIDDNLGDVELLAEASRDAGFHATFEQIAHAQEVLPRVAAIAAATARCPDVILLDLHLPGGDSMALLAHLRGSAGLQEVPIVLCSAVVREQDRTLGQHLGVSDIWQKPETYDAYAPLVEQLRSLAGKGAPTSGEGTVAPVEAMPTRQRPRSSRRRIRARG